LIISEAEVMLDRDLATLYGVPTKHLNQQVKRNRRRFPVDFAFQLTPVEAESIRSRLLGDDGSWHGQRPHAFTEQGAGMLAAVLRTPAAAGVTVQILRAFARVRAAYEPPVSDNTVDPRRTIFAAIRDALLMQPEDRPFTTDVQSTYFVQAGDDGPIKIGSTRNLPVRLRSLVMMSPLPLRLLGVMKGDHEERCHAVLGASRIHGEWFVPSATVLGFIRDNAITPDPADPRRTS
jgi:hypothetical protein